MTGRESAEMAEREAAATLEHAGYGIIPPSQWHIDMDSRFFPLWERVRDYTLTSMERGYALFKGIEYLIGNGIEGDMVECGVYRGGSCMLMALSVIELSAERPQIHLFDTFTGMPEPDENDVIAWNGVPAASRIREARNSGNDDFCRWLATEEEVLSNLRTTGYPMDRFRIVKGDVAETLRGGLPERISFLRLDTDWYASTAYELERLFPRLVRGGILLIDDYGHFRGARKAVDEYFARVKEPLFLSRIDYTGRIGVKV